MPFLLSLKLATALKGLVKLRVTYVPYVMYVTYGISNFHMEKKEPGHDTDSNPNPKLIPLTLIQGCCGTWGNPWGHCGVVAGEGEGHCCGELSCFCPSMCDGEAPNDGTQSHGGAQSDSRGLRLQMNRSCNPGNGFRAIFPKGDAVAKNRRGTRTKTHIQRISTLSLAQMGPEWFQRSPKWGLEDCPSRPKKKFGS